MILKFKEEYKSISKKFEDIEISDFSIFTGKNGSGKTHLLKSIKEVKVSVNDFSKKQILYLNYLDFAQNFQRKTNHSEKVNAWNRMNSTDGNDLVLKLKSHEEGINAFKNEIEAASAKKDIPILDLKSEDLDGNAKATDILDAIQNYKTSILNALEEENYSGDEIAQSVYGSVIRKSKVFLSNVTEKDFNILFQKTVIGSTKILSDLSNVFFEYYKNIDRNERNQQKEKKFLSQEEFNKKYGTAPWELIRNIFLGFGLNFDINDPIQEETDFADGTFQIVFKHKAKRDKIIPFNDLSSGEQILVTLINAIYTTNQKDGLPKLVLLDEIDGPLNPSIIGKFIGYLRDNFISNGIMLIMATHSPTTVAFAPEESVYLIDTNNEKPIKAVSSREGIDILSEGFVTLSDVLEFDKIKESKIVISEGKNYTYLEKARSIFAKEDTDLTILKLNIGGAGQLRTLFDFMRTFNSSKQFIFVFDHDYRSKEKKDDNNGFINNIEGDHEYEPRDLIQIKNITNKNNKIFIFSKEEDSLSARGIENLFKKSTTMDYLGAFDKKAPKNKTGFERYILNRNNDGDFQNFNPLFDFIVNTITNDNL